MKTILSVLFALIVAATASTASAQTNQTTTAIAVDDQLKTQLAELAKTSREGVVTAAQWLCTQAPQVADQYIRLCIFRAWLGIGLALLLVIAGAFICFITHRMPDDSDSDNVSGLVFRYLVCFGVAIMIAAFNIYSLVTAYVAPKVVLIEYVKTLIIK